MDRVLTTLNPTSLHVNALFVTGDRYLGYPIIYHQSNLLDLAHVSLWLFKAIKEELHNHYVEDVRLMKLPASECEMAGMRFLCRRP